MEVQKNKVAQNAESQPQKDVVWGVESSSVDLLAHDPAAKDEFVALDCRCCFVAGAKVLMADGSLKNIEDVVVGEKVWGLSGVNTVIELKRPILGPRRMLEMEDGSLRWSEEHGFWTRNQQGQQWWGSHNKLEWEREVSLELIGGLKNSKEIRQLSMDSEEYAHVDGWKKLSVRQVPADPYTQLYLVGTDRCHSVIVNGFVVGAGISDHEFDFDQVQWADLASLKLAVAQTEQLLQLSKSLTT